LTRYEIRYLLLGGQSLLMSDSTSILSRNGYVTAASTPDNQPFGFVFRNGKITGAPGVQSFLGRPWRDYACVIFLDTEMSEGVRPDAAQLCSAFFAD
jgi:pectinesterase